MTIIAIHGADEDIFPQVEGLEFQKAEKIIRKAMSVPDTIQIVKLNDQENVPPTKQVRDGDRIVFYKRSGTKGCF